MMTRTILTIYGDNVDEVMMTIDFVTGNGLCGSRKESSDDAACPGEASNTGSQPEQSCVLEGHPAFATCTGQRMDEHTTLRCLYGFEWVETRIRESA